MACDTWRDRIDAYADAELSAGEMRAMAEHLHACTSCTSDLLSRVQMKRAIKTAGMRFSPSMDLRERVQKGLPGRKPSWTWGWMPKLAASVALIAVAFLLVRQWSSMQQGRTLAELADLHVATMASSSPVDVVSTDRHTVKPWFQGKIPFTFNLPELSNTPFTLEGGRVSYLEQSPGAQLIYKIGNHRISVFIFQDRRGSSFLSGDGLTRRQTFNVETWTSDGLRYFAVGDADPNDIHTLSEMLKSAERS